MNHFSAFFGYRCWTKRSKCSARFQQIKTGCMSHCASPWTSSSLKQSFVVAEVQRTKAYCTRYLLHQIPFLCTKQLFRQKHQMQFTPEAFCTQQILHRKPFALKTFALNGMSKFALFFLNVPLFKLCGYFIPSELAALLASVLGPWV